MNNIISKEECRVFNMLQEKARDSQDMLYHFTTFESVLSIIKSKSFRLTRKDLLNDKAEKHIGNEELAKHQYIMSMTEEKEYISMWSMYGRPSGIKIRLGFSAKEFLKVIEPFTNWNKFKQDVLHVLYVDGDGILIKPEDAIVNLWEMPYESFKFACVAYLNKDTKNLEYKGKQLTTQQIDELNVSLLTGFVKYDAWEFENEIRIVINPDTTQMREKELDHIFLPISDALIKTFSITFNPWMSQDMKNIVKTQLNAAANCELQYKDSNHDGEVDENRI